MMIHFGVYSLVVPHALAIVALFLDFLLWVLRLSDIIAGVLQSVRITIEVLLLLDTVTTLPIILSLNYSY